MFREKSVLNIDFRFTDQIIGANQIVIVYTNSKHVVVWYDNFEIKYPSNMFKIKIAAEIGPNKNYQK